MTKCLALVLLQVVFYKKTSLQKSQETGIYTNRICPGSMAARCIMFFIIYLEHGCLIDRQSQLWFWKAIDQACLRSESNRSSLWRHIIGTCRRLRWLCRKHSNNVARHNKTPVIKSTLLSRDMNLCRVGVTSCCNIYTFRSCYTCLTTCAVLRPTRYFLLLSPGIL